MAMTEPNELPPSPFWRLLRIVLLSLLVIFLGGVAAGFTAAYLEDGGGFEAKPMAILGTMVLLFAGCAWLLVRMVRKPTGEEPLTRKERANRNLLLASFVLGLAMSFAVLTLGGTNSLLTNDPLPAWLAAGLIGTFCLFVPALSFAWKRTVDEQEKDAYKTGALQALNVYGVGVPIWWIGWRGGFLPEPNGIIIYLVTLFVFCLVWGWKKYR
jgi:predicted membrane protein